jgi:hypothetical protein
MSSGARDPVSALMALMVVKERTGVRWSFDVTMFIAT